jgi:hypothetical protein
MTKKEIKFYKNFIGAEVLWAIDQLKKLKRPEFRNVTIRPPMSPEYDVQVEVRIRRKKIKTIGENNGQ